MKLYLKNKKKIVTLVAVSISLFLLGTKLGTVGRPLEKESEADWSIEAEVESIGENEGIKASKKKIAYGDKLLSKEINQMEGQGGELYIGAKDLSDIIGANIQWNEASKQFILKRGDNYIIVDTKNNLIIDSKEKKENISLYGKEKKSLFPVSKVVSYFGYQVSKLDSLGVFRIKKPDTELLDIEFAQKHQTEFGIEIENYEAKYKAEKAIFEEKYPEKKEPIEMVEIPSEKIAYLTFDDGPNQNTGVILDTMKNYGVKGTFFVLGNNIPGNEHIIKRAYDEGHSIGLHSMNHSYNDVYASPENFVSQMDQCNELVKGILGFRTKLIRPPYGSKPQLTDGFRTAAIESGYRIWDWNIDSKDAYRNMGYQGIYNATVNQASRFEEAVIILFHDKNNTAMALPSIIEHLASRGYKFEAVTEDLLPYNFWKDKRYVN